MNNVQTSLDTFLKQLDNVDAQTRAQLTALTVGVMVGYKADIPSAPVGDLFSYRMNIIDGQIDIALNKVVEECVFNWELAKATARKVWEYRYGMVHTPTYALYTRPIMKMLTHEKMGLVSEQTANCVRKLEKDIPASLTSLLEAAGRSLDKGEV